MWVSDTNRGCHFYRRSEANTECGVEIFPRIRPFPLPFPDYPVGIALAKEFDTTNDAGRRER